MQVHTRLGSSFYVSLLASLAAIVVLALTSSSFHITPHNSYALEESSADERATENSFYDSLAAKDAAKSNDAADVLSRKVAPKKISNSKSNSNKNVHSIRGQFELAKKQLEKAKAKMDRMEEKDRVQAEKQTTRMERMSAHEQAVEYEHHLKRLSDSVFPSSTKNLEDPADAVRDALVDDIHASPKPAISNLRAKAHRTIAHAKAAHKAAAAASASSSTATPSTSIMDTVRRAGEALEKGASDALFSTHSAAPTVVKAAHPKAHAAAAAAAAAHAVKPAKNTEK